MTNKKLLLTAPMHKSARHNGANGQSFFVALLTERQDGGSLLPPAAKPRNVMGKFTNRYLRDCFIQQE